MTAYTSSQSGNFNVNSTWGGGGHPTTTGDTATISADHVVTNAVSVTDTCGAITVTAGSAGRTTFQINGTFNVGGAVSFGGKTLFGMGAGAILDLNGNTITVAATDHQHTFTGTSGSRCTVQSTGSRGLFTISGASSTTVTFDYVDFSGFATSYFGRSHPSEVMQHVQFCTFTDMDTGYVEASARDNTGLLFENNDIRSPVAGSSFPAFAMSQNAAPGTRPITFKNNTLKGGASLGTLLFQYGSGFTSWTGNVLDRYQLSWPNTGAVQAMTGNFWSNLSGDNLAFENSGDVVQLHSDYYYYEGGAHVFGSNIGNFTDIGSIWEARGAAQGTNWRLISSGDSGVYVIQGCIFLGLGTPLSGANIGTAHPTLTMSGNTAVMSNDTSGAGFASYSFGIETEGTGTWTAAAVNYYNNLNVDFNVDDGSTEPAISLHNAAGSQIALANYNGNAGYTGNWQYRRTTVGCWENTDTAANQVAGFGANDVFADPKFNNPKASLADWDKSLGGPGTAANAITELLKLNGTGGAWNSRYLAAGLIAYVQRGLTARNAAFLGTGYQGGNIGAFVSPPGNVAPDRLMVGAD